jgi:hypothetical protein
MPNAVACSPPPGSYMSSHLSMKQSSRQRLSPDLQDMESSSGGVDWVDWVDRCPPQAGERVAYQAFVDPTLCLLWAG